MVLHIKNGLFCPNCHQDKGLSYEEIITALKEIDNDSTLSKEEKEE